MGSYSPQLKCFITGQRIVDQKSSSQAIEYTINYYLKSYSFRFEPDHKNSSFVDSNIYILKGLLLNNQFPDLKRTVLNNSILETLILESWFPRSPKEKIDNLLVRLNKLQSYDGQIVRSNKFGDEDMFLASLFFKSHNEFDFYFDAIVSYGYVNAKRIKAVGVSNIVNYFITIDGLKYLADLEKEGPLSNNCFIALSFDNCMLKTREAIKQAVVQTGFNPIVIDEQNYECDQTINDSIISQIKKSRFCIADFTMHKNGVYFEAGYSLGRGLKVIYCCSKSDFDKAHFDINHYQHIIYENVEELKQRLIDKIEAWVK